jgi:hypothetical protein
MKPSDTSPEASKIYFRLLGEMTPQNGSASAPLFGLPAMPFNVPRSARSVLTRPMLKSISALV